MKHYNLLILGNGFDLACGYKTAYENFYCFLELAKNSTINIFCENFKLNFPKIKYEAVEKHLKKFKSLIDSEFKDNVFIQYFLNYKQSIGSWVAFEAELLNVIKGFDEFFYALKNDEKVKSYCDFVWKIKNNSAQYKVFSFVKKCNMFTIDDIREEQTSTTLWFFVKGTADLTPIQWQVEIDKYIDEFIQLLYSDLNAFSELFAIYLQIITLQDLNDKEFEFEADKLVNYNYTNTYNKRHLFEEDDIEVCYINGSIENENNNIVLGFNCDENFKESRLKILTKSSQRVDKQTDFKMLKKFLPDENAIWEEELSICVFGHSLDKADKDTLEMIFNNYKSCNIDIYYLNNLAKQHLITNLQVILTQKKFDKLYANDQIHFIPCVK